MQEILDSEFVPNAINSYHMLPYCGWLRKIAKSPIDRWSIPLLNYPIIYRVLRCFNHPLNWWSISQSTVSTVSTVRPSASPVPPSQVGRALGIAVEKLGKTAGFPIASFRIAKGFYIHLFNFACLFIFWRFFVVFVCVVLLLPAVDCVATAVDKNVLSAKSKQLQHPQSRDTPDLNHEIS